MGTFFVYILKSSICLAGFYLFYRLLLSKETFHRFNRIALLGLLFLSLLIPFIQITTVRQTEMHQTMLTIEQLLMMAMTTNSGEVVAQGEEPTVSGIQIALLVYLSGILFFACRNLYSLTRLLALVRCGKKEKLEKGITLVVHQKEIPPFSWMKYVVISRNDLEENGREILIHEIAHIRSRHSIDLLVADICVFFQWFNPAVWLLKQELQNIHEYEADERVIKEGVDAKQYQLLLIKKAVGTRLYSMANSFNHHSLKRRITMMQKEKSTPWACLKYLYVLPLATIAVTAFARPEVSVTADEIAAVEANDLTGMVVPHFLSVLETQQNALKKVPIKKATDDERYGDAKNLISVKLYVVDENEKPVAPGAVIALPFGSNTGTLSKENGLIELTNIPAGNELKLFYVATPTEGVRYVKAKRGMKSILPSAKWLRAKGKSVSLPVRGEGSLDNQ